MTHPPRSASTDELLITFNIALNSSGSGLGNGGVLPPTESASFVPTARQVS